MLSYQCICSNITFQVNPSEIEIPSNQWENPIIGTGKIEVKYNSFITTTQIGKWSLVHCNSCNHNGCLLSDGEIVINPEFKQTQELRSKLTFSKTFNLYVDLKPLQNNSMNTDGNIVQNNSNNNSIGNNQNSFRRQNSFVNSLSLGNVVDPVEKELMKIKQKRVEQLFQEKERKIKQFMMEQDEIYENERKLISIELEAIRLQLENNSVDLPNLNMNSMREKKLKESNDIFDMDEDFDISPNNNNINNNFNRNQNEFTFGQFENDEMKDEMKNEYQQDDLDEMMKSTKLTFDSPHEFDSDEIETIDDLSSNGNSSKTSKMNEIKTSTFDFDSDSDDSDNDSLNEMRMGSFSTSAQAIVNAKPLKVKKEFPSTFKEYTMNSLTNNDELPVSGSFVSTFDL